MLPASALILPFHDGIECYSVVALYGGMESEPMLTPREKSPRPEKFSSEEDGTHDAASSRTASPTHHQRAIRVQWSDTNGITWYNLVVSIILPTLTEIAS